MHEINLLPPSRRLRLRRQRIQETLQHFFRHVQTVSLFLLIMTVGVAGVIQFMLVISPDEGEAVVTNLVRQYQAARQSIIDKNSLVEEVKNVGANRVVWSDHINDILNLLPPGTTVKEMRVSNSPIQLTFSGTSVNRNSLIILGNRLQTLPWAKEVQKPLENLLARDNPDYSFTILVSTDAAAISSKETTQPSPVASPGPAASQ